MIEAVIGTPWAELAHTLVIDPLGMRDTVACTSADLLASRAGLVPLVLPAGVGRPEPVLSFSSPATVAHPNPAAGVRGPMRDLARLFDHLRDPAAGPPGPCGPTTIAAVTARHRVGLSQGFSRSDWGLGLELESHHLGPDAATFGHHTSLRSFGHHGLRTSMAFTDPEAGLTVAAFFNGQLIQAAHHARMLALSDAIYADLRPLTPGGTCA